jgi:NAD(P)-dependent dehydrogenase (short-subunit alcohol dehydrogenase family)
MKAVRRRRAQNIFAEPMSFEPSDSLTDDRLVSVCTWEIKMGSLTGKNVVVIGGSRGVGRQIVQTAVDVGANVLAVARNSRSLDLLASEVSSARTLALDATHDDAPITAFEAMDPDILVIGGGCFPPVAPLHEQTWQEFAVNWESDVKIGFNFLKAALTRPLRPGSTVILLSSGAGFAGSPISGGYAGAKRTQIFMMNYSQKEADRLGLDLRFAALAPRIMPDSDLGRHAVAGYARYLGMPEADFIEGMSFPPNMSDVAAAFLELATGAGFAKGQAFIVSGKGMEVANA